MDGWFKNYRELKKRKAFWWLWSRQKKKKGKCLEAGRGETPLVHIAKFATKHIKWITLFTIQRRRLLFLFLSLLLSLSLSLSSYRLCSSPALFVFLSRKDYLRTQKETEYNLFRIRMVFGKFLLLNIIPPSLSLSLSALCSDPVIEREKGEFRRTDPHSFRLWEFDYFVSFSLYGQTNFPSLILVFLPQPAIFDCSFTVQLFPLLCSPPNLRKRGFYATFTSRPPITDVNINCH